MKKLTLVVNCTERKSVRASANTSVRNLPAGSVTERVEEWSRRLRSEPAQASLDDLYKGEAWAQVQELRREITASGVEVDLLVASAGLGLRSVEDRTPSYAATFASSQPDSVVSNPAESQDWWALLNSVDSASKLNEIGSSPVLFVLSDGYARAIHQDLVRVARKSADCLIVGGWKDVDGMSRVPADRALRSSLGGTVSSLNLRMARSWWAQRKSSALVGPNDHETWTRWRTSVRVVESWGRRPATDRELSDLAATLKESDPTMSASRALRVVRDSGIACEQKRFGQIFHSTGVR